MHIEFYRDGDLVATLNNVTELNTIWQHMRGYKAQNLLDANPLLFNLKMATIRKLTMKDVAFDVTAYTIKNNRVIQIINMKTNSNTHYSVEPSLQLIEVPTAIAPDIKLNDSIIILR